MSRISDLTNEEHEKMRQIIAERLEKLGDLGGPEGEAILAISRPMCRDCYNFHPTYEAHGECRAKAPPWVSLNDLYWCGEFWSHAMTRIDSALRRLALDVKK